MDARKSIILALILDDISYIIENKYKCYFQATFSTQTNICIPDTFCIVSL